VGWHHRERTLGVLPRAKTVFDTLAGAILYHRAPCPCTSLVSPRHPVGVRPLWVGARMARPMLATYPIRRRRKRSRGPLVVVVQATEQWPGDDWPRDIDKRCPSARDSLVDSLVRPRLVEVLPVLPDQPTKMVLIEHADVVEHLPPGAAYEPLRDRVHVRRAHRRLDRPNPGTSGHPVEGRSVLVVPVAEPARAGKNELWSKRRCIVGDRCARAPGTQAFRLPWAVLLGRVVV
jgi:hypothetical protein